MKESTKKTTQEPIINAFSVDVEGFIESNLQSFYIPDKYIDRHKENSEIEKNVEVLLQILHEANIKGTFFFVGRLAQDMSSLVRKVSQANHEIGCHNHTHLRIFDEEKDVFRVKLAGAKKNLEDVSGQQVYGFRAPDFSITKTSLWALNILKELGFVYDSSIYPIGLHDVYGIKDSPSSIYTLPNGLIEFPLSTIKFFKQRLPFGGGGYFRLYPLWLTKRFIASLNKRNIPCMFYIHPYEVGPVIPRISEISGYRKFRHYYHCKNGDRQVKKLLDAFKFGPAITVLKQTGLIPDRA